MRKPIPAKDKERPRGTEGCSRGALESLPPAQHWGTGEEGGLLLAPSTAQVGAVHEDACRVKVVMCSRNSGLWGLVEAEQGIALTPSASQQRLGWSRKKNPPLGQPAGSAQSLAEGEDGGQHRGHSELLCSGCAPPPPQVGLREEGATCKPSLRGCNPWVPSCRFSAVTPPSLAAPQLRHRPSKFNGNR